MKLFLKTETDKVGGKMELAIHCRELMPEGKPNFLSVINYPMIKDLRVRYGDNHMMKVLFLMVKDFCDSINVVRNMNESQMIEASSMLLDECSNFRLEDYTMMFQMGKRGELFDIHDRIDLQVITNLLDKYWEKRNDTSEKSQTEHLQHLETMGDTTRLLEKLNKKDAELLTLGEGMAAAFGGLKDLVTEKIGNREEREKLREIEKADTEAIRQKQKEQK